MKSFGELKTYIGLQTKVIFIILLKVEIIK